jgi:hypothetical protein
MGIDHLKSTFGGMKAVTWVLKQFSTSPSLSKKIHRAISFYHRVSRAGNPRLDRISLVKKYSALWRRAVLFKKSLRDYKQHGMVSVVNLVLERMRREKTDVNRTWLDESDLKGWDSVLSTIRIS